MFGLSRSELKVFKRLRSPIKIQDFLDTLPINWEKKGDTYMSPRRVLSEKKAHCLEGALFAAVALWVHGEHPLVVDLKAVGDIDHVIAVYKRNGYWGAISKTNHSTLRFRDPVYKTIRELALSYFHEYFNDTNGKKALRSFSNPVDLSKIGEHWITRDDDLHDVALLIDSARHISILPKINLKFIRKADVMERKAGKLIEWKKASKRT